MGQCVRTVRAGRLTRERAHALGPSGCGTVAAMDGRRVPRAIVRRLKRVRPGRVGRRRLRLYGVGNGRSGTTSLARMFGFYCTGHEVDRERMRSVGAQVLTGRLDANAATVRDLLRARSVAFRLEV